jgi:hypothetical protein
MKKLAFVAPRRCDVNYPTTIWVERDGKDRMARMGYYPSGPCRADSRTGKTLVRYIVPLGMMLTITETLHHDGVAVVSDLGKEVA